MKKIREQFLPGVLILVYVLCSIRYYPGRWRQTLVETLLHVLGAVPISMGITLIAVALLQKLAGARLPWDRILRIFLTVAIVLEFLYGVAHYLKTAG